MSIGSLNLESVKVNTALIIQDTKSSTINDSEIKNIKYTKSGEISINKGIITSISINDSSNLRLNGSNVSDSIELNSVSGCNLSKNTISGNFSHNKGSYSSIDDSLIGGSLNFLDLNGCNSISKVTVSGNMDFNDCGIVSIKQSDSSNIKANNIGTFTLFKISTQVKCTNSTIVANYCNNITAISCNVRSNGCTNIDSKHSLVLDNQSISLSGSGFAYSNAASSISMPTYVWKKDTETIEVRTPEDFDVFCSNMNVVATNNIDLNANQQIRNASLQYTGEFIDYSVETQNYEASAMVMNIFPVTYTVTGNIIDFIASTSISLTSSSNTLTDNSSHGHS